MHNTRTISAEASLKDLPGDTHVGIDAATKTFAADSGNRELDVSYANVTSRDYLMKRVWDGFARYLTELNFPWYSTWAGYSGIRFNKYSEDRLMAEHCDHIHSMFDGTTKGIPIMSFVGVLNDDYEGGELQLDLNGEIKNVKLSAGSSITYRTGIPHCVNEVTKGNRDVAVFWTKTEFPDQHEWMIMGGIRKAMSLLECKNHANLEEAREDPYFVLATLMHNIERKTLSKTNDNS